MNISVSDAYEDEPLDELIERANPEFLRDLSEYTETLSGSFTFSDSLSDEDRKGLAANLAESFLAGVHFQLSAEEDLPQTTVDEVEGMVTLRVTQETANNMLRTLLESE